MLPAIAPAAKRIFAAKIANFDISEIVSFFVSALSDYVSRFVRRASWFAIVSITFSMFVLSLSS